MQIENLLQNVSEKEYRQADRLNYSLIKALAETGPSVLTVPQPKIDNSGVILGGIVDKLLTTDNYVPENDFEVRELAVDFSGNTNISKIYKYLKEFPEITLTKDESGEAMLKRVYDIVGIKRAPEIDDTFWNTVETINKINSGVKFITPSELELAYTMVNTLSNHKYTQHIFIDEDGTKSFNQAIIYATIFDVDVKIMIDKLFVNSNDNTIIIRDIKTGSGTFIKNFFDYKYYYQGSLYYKILELVLLASGCGYILKPYFEFIYVGRSNPYVPTIYRMDKEYIDKVWSGFTTNTGSTCRGLVDLIKDYKYYIDNTYFETTRELEEANGVVNLITPITI